MCGLFTFFLGLPYIEISFICLSRCRGRPGDEHKGDNEEAGICFLLCFLTLKLV